jgi:hypothetical protein
MTFVLQKIQFSLYESDETKTSGDPADIVEKELIFPYPVDTDKFKVVILEGETEVNMKLELLGMTAQERYGLNPYMDHTIIEKGDMIFLSFLGHIYMFFDMVLSSFFHVCAIASTCIKINMFLS